MRQFLGIKKKNNSSVNKKLFIKKFTTVDIVTIWKKQNRKNHRYKIDLKNGPKGLGKIEHIKSFQ